MRRGLAKLSQPVIGHPSRQTVLSSSSSSSFGFSTSAGNGGDGGGRGRGRGSGIPKFSFVDTPSGKTEPPDPQNEPSYPSPVGSGRGQPLQSPPKLPQFSAFVASVAHKSPVAGRGRGHGVVLSPQVEESMRTKTPVFFQKDGQVDSPRKSQPQSEENSNPGTPQKDEQVDLPPQSPSQSEENVRARTPLFFRKDEQVDLPQDSGSHDQVKAQEEGVPPLGILSLLSGAGRGKPPQASLALDSEKAKEINRHIRPRPPGTTSPKLSKEEAINKARDILSRGGDSGYGASGTRGGRGRGQRGGWSGRVRGRGRGRVRDSDDTYEDAEENTEVDKANAEKLAETLGSEKMALLVEGFEQASARVLPSPKEDAYVDSMHTNLMIECEPEYMMAEFDSNPDIDEKPPIPLKDALEKMKPFLMAYENIQSNKEWEEIVEETMKTVPLMKEVVDYYSGPYRVTAKKQQEELQRVAKTLPVGLPSSVKQFTDRAVLSLQSNPGWGFDRKCQFMDKLVQEISRDYK